jgi:hypothetical protein
MTDVVRAKTSTGDWCKPTAELPNRDLAQLLHRTRRDSNLETAVIVDRPPAADPAPRPRFRTAELNEDPTRTARRPRMALERLTDRLVRLTVPRSFAYPTAPASYTWVWPAVVAVMAAAVVAVAIMRPF